MNRKPVESTNLKSIGYDEHLETLEVEFQDGLVYQYFNVPAPIAFIMQHEELHQDSSIGEYFAQNIRGKFQYKKVQ